MDESEVSTEMGIPLTWKDWWALALALERLPSRFWVCLGRLQQWMSREVISDGLDFSTYGLTQ